jgi:hypothetical protein
MSCFAKVLLLGLLAAALAHPTAWSSEGTLDDEPAPDSVEGLHGPLDQPFRERIREETLFPRLKRKLQTLPSFFRDTELVLKPRWYYFSRRDLDDDRQNAWTFGGSLAYRSGWWKDFLSVGVEAFSSWKVVGKERHDGTLLLKPGQESYSVVGLLYAQLRHEDQVLTLYRQELDLPYVNKRYNRMTPNTFEGYTLQGAFSKFNYIVGHLTRMKKRNEDNFSPMSEAAGVPGGRSRGLTLTGVQYSPSERLSIGAINYFGKDYLNIFYAETGYTRSLTDELSLKLEAQFTDQRSVGDDLLTGSSFNTWVLGGRAAISLRNAILTAAFSTTDDEAAVQSPFGSYPGYLSLMQRNFFRADEDAWLVGLSYTFSRLGMSGLSAYANFARGVGARDADTGAALGDHTELDLTIDYRLKEGLWRGFWLRLRGSLLKEDGAAERSKEVRIILNYQIPVL